MKGLSFKTTAVLFMILTISNIFGQNTIMKAIEMDIENNTLITSNIINPETSYDFSFLNTTDSYYNLELFSNWSGYFNGSITMELEEEPDYESGLQMLRDFMYLNLNMSYTIGKVGFSFAINNILNLNNSEFEIVPELYGNNNIIQDFYFVQDQSFSIQTAITYTF